MTPDEMVDVIVAHKYKKVVEYKPIDSSTVWGVMHQNHKFNFNYYVYRIKKEPKEWWINPFTKVVSETRPKINLQDYILVREVLK